MNYVIALVCISLAGAFSCTSAAAGRDGAQLLHQAQTLQRIKQAGGVDARSEPRRPQLAYWDSRRSPL